MSVKEFSAFLGRIPGTVSDEKQTTKKPTVEDYNRAHSALAESDENQIRYSMNFS